MRIIETDQKSGFCFGVVGAIQRAEKELSTHEELYCLGDIVHNSQEVARLQTKGLKTITHAELGKMQNKKVLLRAHGEPPSTYETAHRNNIHIIDATCPVVIQLQKKIRKTYLSDPKNSQIVIFGKPGHAEVNALVGQTEGNAIVIERREDIKQLDLNRNTYLFSQTTMSVDDFREIAEQIASKINPPTVFLSFDTICRQVANKIPHIHRFAAQHNLILFVAGRKSSNGKVLLNECKKANPNTHLISSEKDIQSQWLDGIRSVGVCGATSTPKWLMEKIADTLRKEYNE